MEYKLAKLLYTRGCNEYLRLFCEKHGFSFEDAKQSWVADRVGDVVHCGDYYVDFRDIIIDVEEDPSEDEYIKYHDYCLSASEFDLPQINYKSWLHGCPRLSKEQFTRLRLLKESLKEAINDAKESCKQI